MAKNIKHLIKIYDEYKKIKGYSEGEVVQPYESDDSNFSELKKKFQKVFSTPTPTPPPEDSQEDKYAKIRKQNRANFGYSQGGKVEKPHNKANLQKLKEAFDSFLKEEGGYYDGGPIRGYSEGEVVQPDPMEGNVSPEQYAANLEALKKQYKSTPVQGDDQLITADNNQPDQSEDTKSAEDKLVEEPYADEELAAKLKEEKPDEEMADEDSDEEDDSEPETMVASKKDSKEEPKKEDKSRELASNEKLEELQYTPSQAPENDLARAQKQRDMNIAGQQIMKGAALFGAGASKTDPTQALKSIGDNDQYVNLPVLKYQEQMKNQGKDPSSPMTKAVENYLTSKGLKTIKGASADDYLKFMPFLAKDEALKTQINKVITQQAGALERNSASNKTKTEIADKNRDAAMERTKMGNEGKVAAAKAGQEARMGKEQRDAQVKAENDLNSTRGKQALMMAQRNLMSVKNAQKMLQEFPDTNKWTPQQVALFNSEIAKIATGGVPTEGQLHELANPTAASKVAEYAQKLANVPVGAEQGKFIANNKKYLEGLSDVSHQTIKDNMGNTIKAYEDKLGPEAYKKLLYRHSDALGLLTPAQEKGLDAVMQAKGIPREEAIKALVKQGVIKDLSY